MKLSFWNGFKLELDDDFIADELVGFSRVNNSESLAVDVEFRLNAGLAIGERGGGGKGDVFGGLVEG